MQVRGQMSICPRQSGIENSLQASEIQDRFVSHLPQRRLLPLRSPMSLCPRPGRGPQRSRPVARQEDTRTRQTTANVWKKWRRFLVLQLQHREQGRDALRCGPAGQILQHVQQPSISNLIKRFFQKRLLLFRRRVSSFFFSSKRILLHLS